MKMYKLFFPYKIYKTQLKMKYGDKIGQFVKFLEK